MSKRIIASVVVVAGLHGGAASAQVMMDVSKITCEQYVHSKISSPNYLVAWLSGYYHGQQGTTVLDQQAVQDNVGKLKTYCYQSKNFETPLMKAIEELFASK